MTTDKAARGRRRRWVGNGLLLIAALLATIWSIAALAFDFPRESLRLPLAVGYGLAVLIGVLRTKGRWRAAVCFAGFLLVLIWWRSLGASNDRDWQADVAETAWAEIRGDEVTIHNMRDCDYRAEFDYTCEWKTRTIDLSKISGMDLFLTYWGSPWIAHPIVSFEMSGEEPVAMSIETRKEVGETYSAVRGFFRYYELAYVVSEERDVVRLRSNYRTGEDVYLFHTRATPQLSRAVFVDYLRRANELHQKAEWYNALTDNCTTNVAVHLNESQKNLLPSWDWRILLNGKADQMLYEHGDLAGDLPFAELKQRAHINAAARVANDAPDFWWQVRKGRPGFPAQPPGVEAGSGSQTASPQPGSR